MKADYKAIIWDLDGVVIDSLSLRLAAVRNAASEAGVQAPTEKELRKWLCDGPKLALNNIPGANTSLREFERFCRREAHKFIAGFQGIDHTLEALQQAGVRQGLVTSRTATDTQRWMDMCHVPNLFQVQVTYSDRLPPKPDPASLLAATRRLGIDPEEAAYVGDTTIDGIASRRANVAFLFAAWGTPDVEEVLSHVHADLVLNSPMDVLTRVRRSQT